MDALVEVHGVHTRNNISGGITRFLGAVLGPLILLITVHKREGAHMFEVTKMAHVQKTW